ncbi:MAG: hypothetical protein KKH21_16165 [Gammaproteobacteria bacterium]|nr:hypothetical protein [Gammaproteobacteria bacterium]MBU0892397.1 hypothetical protein [Gammaproteobacteria bacterium]
MHSKQPLKAPLMNESWEQAREAFVRGIALFGDGRYEPADEAFTQALALAPGRAASCATRGIGY